MVRGGCVMTASGDARLPRIDSRDIGEAVAAVLADTDKHGGRVVSLTGGERLRESELVEVLGKVTGKSVAYSPDPSPLHDLLRAIPIAEGLSVWDEMSALWA
eukprot:1042977-Rhodomonas_salina.1